jgi:hypothetical protein
MSGQMQLPPRVRALILAVAAGGAMAMAVRLADLGSWNSSDALAWLLLALGIALAEQFPIRLSFRTERISFSVTEAVWIGGLMAARPSVVALSVGVGILAGHGLRRKPLPKLAFNVGQFVLSVTAAQLVFAPFHAGSTPGPRVWLATAVAMVAYAVVNAGLVALVISQVEGVPFRSVVVPPLGANALHYAGNTAIALAAATMWTTSALAFPVFAMMLVLAFTAYQTWLGRIQRTRLAGLRDLVTSAPARVPAPTH